MQMTSKSVSGSSRNVPVPSTSASAAAELQSNRGAQRQRIEPVRDNDGTSADRKKMASSFKQQQLSSWQPTIVPGVASPTLFLIAIICLPVGIAIWHFSNEIHEKIISYTDCKASNGTPCSEFMGKKGPSPDPGMSCECRVPFRLKTNFNGTVYMYYALTNFYQNHRQYVRSRDDAQLFGGTEKPNKRCKPFGQKNETTGIKDYWPCGANARSMFQDKIELFYGKPEKPVPLKRKGLAWSSDKEYKFRNPKDWDTEKFKVKRVKPDTWIRSPWELDMEDSSNNGLENEDLIIWMRTSAFPNFRKLYRIVDQTGEFKEGLPKGNYCLKINYTFPVKNFNGTKSIILSTTSVLGGKNSFIGILFVIIGVLCLCMGFFFFGVLLLQRRKRNVARVGIAVPDDYRSPYQCDCDPVQI